MKIFLDTADVSTIIKHFETGLIDGVTTNPSILVSEGLKPGIKNLEIQSKKVAKLLKKLPLSIEVTSNNYKEMLNQSIKFTSWSKNINVKITIHGPNGELDNLKLIHELEVKKILE